MNRLVVLLYNYVVYTAMADSRWWFGGSGLFGCLLFACCNVV